MIRENPKVVGGARKTGKIHEIKSTWHMVLKDVGGEGGGHGRQTAGERASQTKPFWVNFNQTLHQASLCEGAPIYMYLDACVDK